MELIQIQQALDQRIKTNPIKYFWPHQRNCDGTQCDTVNLEYETYDSQKHTIQGCPQFFFINSNAHTKAFFGSNRSGKTTATVFCISMFTTGYYPKWYTGKQWGRPTKGRIFVKNFDNPCKVITDKLHELLPQDCYICPPKKNNQGAEVHWYIKFKDGRISYFDIQTYEQKTEAAEGSDQDWIVFDEPPPRDLYIAATRGLVDRDGITLFALTPLKEPWLFDEVYNSKDENIDSYICDMRHNSERLNPLTNKLIGLKESAIRKFEKKLTEEERETRMHGKFRYLAGRVWKEWDRNIHTFDRKIWVSGKNNVLVDGEPPKHWPRIMLIDPHDRNPHALIWIAIDEAEQYWAYREAWLANCLIEDAVLHIKKVELVAGERVLNRVMDPNFGPKRYANRGLTVRDEFEESSREIQYPIRFSFGDDHKEVGRKAVAKLLMYEKSQPVSLINHPRLVVAKDLKECIYQIEHYVWDEYRTKVDRDPVEKPKDLNTHFPDLLHYFALSNFGWNQPKIKPHKRGLYG